MALKIFEKAITKVILYTLLFIVLLRIGYITVWVSLNMDQTPLIRFIIGACGPVWAVISVWYIASQKNYLDNWRRVLNEKVHHDQKMDTQFYPEYLELKDRFPLAIRRHEQHCRHHGIDVEEMVSQAMKVSIEEWEEREAFRRASREERHRDDGKNTYEPSRDRKHRHI